jgi:membrane protein required for colicin V production
MNWLSLLLVAGIALFTWRAYRIGFIRELVSLSALILAIPVAGLLYDDLARKLDPIITNPLLARLVAFLAILIAVIIAGQVGAHLLKRTVNLLNLGWADQWAGAAFGLLKGVLLAQVLLIALVAYPKPDVRETIDNSSVATFLLDSAPAVLALLPTHFDEAIDAFPGILVHEEEPPGARAPTASR